MILFVHDLTPNTSDTTTISLNNPFMPGDILDKRGPDLKYYQKQSSSTNHKLEKSLNESGWSEFLISISPSSSFWKMLFLERYDQNS